jgi:hypothetical protein
MALAMALTMTAYAAPTPDKSLLGVKILSDWKAVLSKFGQPTRVEAGPLSAGTVSPMTSTGGMAMFQPPTMGGMAGLGGIPMPGGAMMGGMAGAPSSPMMGGMSSAGGAGGAPRAPMMGGMASAGGRGLPGLGGMGAGITAPGGASSGMMGPPMMGGGMTAPGRPGMGGMSSSGGMSTMMRPPMMGGMGAGNPRMGGMAAGNPRMGGTGSFGVGAEMPGLDMMAGGPGAPGAMGGGGAAAFGGGTDAGEGEVSWVYEKGTTTHVFLFNNEGRVIQIQSFGYKAGARTANGVGLGDTSAKIYSIYGFPEETIVSGKTRTLDYSKRANVAFQLAERNGKMQVVGITVGLVKAPNPEHPEDQ